MDDIAVLGFETKSNSGGKEFTVFNIFVTANGRIHHVKKRYSELLETHKELKKCGHVPSFPPKNVRNQNRQVIEVRRQALHSYFQTVVRATNLKETLFDLLGVPRIQSVYREDNASSSTLNSGEEPQHGRILYFSQDLQSFCHEAIKTQPNAVVTGVLRGLYSD